MYEFDTVSASSPADLARSLTQRSADGWEVVSIVGTTLEVTAFLKRSRSSTETTGTVTAGTASTIAAATVVDEPAGWGVAPASTTAGTDPWSATAASPQPASQPVLQPTAASANPEPAGSTTPQVPAGWYADPAGRYELRYWDGGQWTEHVARGGTQYTDPPVA